MQNISHFWAKMKKDPKRQLGRFCPEPFNYYYGSCTHLDARFKKKKTTAKNRS